MKYTRRKLFLALSIVLVGLGGLVLYPWKRVVVAPAIRVRVLDEDGNPARWATVKQEWEYRVIGSTGHVAITAVDENGYASFPERTERVTTVLDRSSRFGPMGPILTIGPTILSVGTRHFLKRCDWGVKPSPNIVTNPDGVRR